MAFETAVEGHEIYAVPQLDDNRINNAGSDYDDDLFAEIRLISGDMAASHTRLTHSEGRFDGEENEAGSVETTFSFYNNSIGSILVYNGTDTTPIAIDPGKKADVKRRAITEAWEYEPFFADQSSDNDATLDNFPESGATITRNIYFFPRWK